MDGTGWMGWDGMDGMDDLWLAVVFCVGFFRWVAVLSGT